MISNFEFIIHPFKSSVAFYIFNYPVRFYGIIMMISLFIGFISLYSFFKKHYSKLVAEQFVDYSPFLIIFSFVGARLFYIIGQFSYYKLNPFEIIMINHGGISILGGIIFGISGLYILSKIYKFDFLEHIDCFAVFMPLCQAIGRWGNYFNQEAFGLPSNGFIKLFVDKPFRPLEFMDVDYFHPAFLYESIFDIMIFIILYFTFNKKQKGKSFFSYLFLYSAVRIIIESIRIDSVMNILNIPIAIIISLILFVIGAFGLIYVLKKPQ